MVGAFTCNDALIGTIRVIPMDRGLTPCESLLQQQSLLSSQYYEESWEVGRLVLGPQYRSGPEALKRCLFLTLLHLMQSTDIKNLFASCSPLLARLYRRFGFSVLIKDACAKDGETYSLIHGHAPSVLMALAGSEAEKAQADQQLALARQLPAPVWKN
jgi:predicted GNAT family N-acyltransferase